jgi:hypothetical protein
MNEPFVKALLKISNLQRASEYFSEAVCPWRSLRNILLIYLEPIRKVTTIAYEK